MLVDMEGGIRVGELSVQMLADLSLVAQGKGLFIKIYDDIDEN